MKTKTTYQPPLNARSYDPDTASGQARFRDSAVKRLKRLLAKERAAYAHACQELAIKRGLLNETNRCLDRAISIRALPQPPSGVSRAAWVANALHKELPVFPVGVISGVTIHADQAAVDGRNGTPAAVVRYNSTIVITPSQYTIYPTRALVCGVACEFGAATDTHVAIYPIYPELSDWLVEQLRARVTEAQIDRGVTGTFPHTLTERYESSATSWKHYRDGAVPEWFEGMLAEVRAAKAAYRATYAREPETIIVGPLLRNALADRLVAMCGGADIRLAEDNRWWQREVFPQLERHLLLGMKIRLANNFTRGEVPCAFVLTA